MATHKSLKVTFWTRCWDLIKGFLLYGTISWKRASDELKPPRLSTHDRKRATPALNPEVIKPRHNPQAALIKSTPLQDLRGARDITAGAIVSDPPAEFAPPPPPSRIASRPPPVHGHVVSASTESAPGDGLVVVRRRRRHGIQAQRAPRSAILDPASGKPSLFARLFGSK